MFQVRSVLFPVDFSDACRAASEQIAATAAHFGAKLVLLHVVQTPAWYGDAVAFNAVVDVEEIAEERRAALENVLKDRDDVVIQRTIGYGEPGQAIVECARRQHFDLIMMPTHGCGPFRRFLIGSITAKVLHDVEVPVWTDAHLPRAEPDESLNCVICAVDLTPEIVTTMEWASQYSQSFGLELRLVHAVPWYSDGRSESASLRHVIDDARDTIADLEHQAGVEAPLVIKPGGVADVLHEAALRYRARTIVIGQGALHRVMGRLRTNAYAIVREAPCPVVRC